MEVGEARELFHLLTKAFTTESCRFCSKQMSLSVGSQNLPVQFVDLCVLSNMNPHLVQDHRWRENIYF